MAKTREEREKFDSEPNRFIEDKIKNYIMGSPKNRLEHIDGKPIFEEPLVGFAEGDDKLFYDYKKIIGDFHYTPREALSTYLEAKGLKNIPEPQRLSVIIWILPITRETKLSLRKESVITSLRWNHTRIYGEELNKELQLHMVSFFEELGYRAVAPMYTDFFKFVELPDGLASNWSQRHAAYVAGLGTFSLNDGFITSKGIAHRIGSVVVDIGLTPSPRVYANHLANCLYYKDKSCRRCIERCPVSAITEQGHDKKKCYDYLRTGMAQAIRKLGKEEGYIFTTVGCGFCQTKVPCESKIPPVLRNCTVPSL